MTIESTIELVSTRTHTCARMHIHRHAQDDAFNIINNYL